jgi:Ca-activated chloride channel family protein
MTFNKPDFQWLPAKFSNDHGMGLWPFIRQVCLVGFLFQLLSGNLTIGQSPSSPTSIETTHETPAPGRSVSDTPGLPIGPGMVIRTNVKLALVNVNVTDPFDRIVVGLDQDNFRVFEDGVEQEILTFSSEDVPISLGVILDLSESMTNKIDKARAAIMQFLKAANKQDDFFLVGFNAEPELMSEFTHDPEKIQNCILLSTPRGRTALLDAIYLGLDYMRHSKRRRRALLIFSDGGDNHSRHSEKEIRRLVLEADVQLYAIGFYDPLGYPNRTLEEIHGPSLLEEITEMTGGQVSPGGHLDDLSAIAAKIGAELRHQYVLGYTSSNHDYDGQWRKIKVKLRPPLGAPPLLVHAKIGYYATAQ